MKTAHPFIPVCAAARALTGCQFPSSHPLTARSTVNTALVADHGTLADLRLVINNGSYTEVLRPSS